MKYKFHVAVYGTLKKGFGNHYHLANAEFLGKGKTVDKLKLCIDGLPYLIKGKDDNLGKNVEVEVYACNVYEFYDIDRLEGHPEYYKREKIDIEMFDGTIRECWVYMVDSKYDNGIYHERFAKTISGVYF